MPPEIERYIVGWKDMSLDGAHAGLHSGAAVAAAFWPDSRPPGNVRGPISPTR